MVPQTPRFTCLGPPILTLALVAFSPFATLRADDPPAVQPAEPPRRPAPRDDPVLNDPSIEDTVAEQQRRRAAGAPVRPVPAVPAMQAPGSIPPPSTVGLPDGRFALPVRTVYPEGTFLSAMPGAIVRTSAGDVIFIPDPPDPVSPGPAAAAAPAARSEPPMVLLASQKLAQLEAATSAAEGVSDITLSGQVFLYMGRHYLLPTAFSLAPASRPTTPGPSTPALDSTTSPASRPDAAADPRVEDLIRELDARRGTPRALDPAAPRPPTDEVPPVAAALTAEGTLITGRRGRLVRLAEANGRFAFVADSDPDSPAPPPMLLLPCRMLQEIEAVASLRGEDIAFRLSGRVFSHAGRNYILPVLFRVTPPSDVRPMQ